MATTAEALSQRERQMRRIEELKREAMGDGKKLPKRTPPQPAEDDVFVSGAKLKAGEYVFEPVDYIRDFAGKTVGASKPIKAIFKEHQFDAQQYAMSLGWTNEEKEYVKACLRAHPDYNLVYYEASQTGPEEPAIQWCQVVLMEGGEAQLCGKAVVDGTEFCAVHVEAADLVS
jgi:hypothetical protein